MSHHDARVAAVVTIVSGVTASGLARDCGARIVLVGVHEVHGHRRAQGGAGAWRDRDRAGHEMWRRVSEACVGVSHACAVRGGRNLPRNRISLLRMEAPLSLLQSFPSQALLVKKLVLLLRLLLQRFCATKVHTTVTPQTETPLEIVILYIASLGTGGL